jgi:2-methylcitrate dehydratase PrpD
MQPAIDGLISLAKEHDLDPAEVAAVTVHCLPAGFRLIAEPAEQKANPQETTEAQFSMPFGAAVALARRQAGLDEFGEKALGDPTIRGLLAKVRCIQSKELGKIWPKQWSAEVEVETTDGRRLACRVENPKGDPTNPFTEAELEDKFSELAAPCLPVEQRGRLAEAAKGVGRLRTMDTLWGLFPALG